MARNYLGLGGIEDRHEEKKLSRTYRGVLELHAIFNAGWEDRTYARARDPPKTNELSFVCDIWY